MAIKLRSYCIVYLNKDDYYIFLDTQITTYFGQPLLSLMLQMLEAEAFARILWSQISPTSHNSHTLGQIITPWGLNFLVLTSCKLYCIVSLTFSLAVNFGVHSANITLTVSPHSQPNCIEMKIQKHVKFCSVCWGSDSWATQ